jgi:hypothetical protein
MEVRISKLLLLLLLITFFVIRPFIVFHHYAYSEAFAASNVDYLLTKTSLKKREQNTTVCASHVSACDNTSLRKILLGTCSRFEIRVWKEFLFALAALISLLSCIYIKGKGTLLQVISPQQHFYSLCVLRI